MYIHVIWSTIIDVSEEPAASFFRAVQYPVLGKTVMLLGRVDKGWNYERTNERNPQRDTGLFSAADIRSPLFWHLPSLQIITDCLLPFSSIIYFLP
jgi:hypothetical protein